MIAHSEAERRQKGLLPDVLDLLSEKMTYDNKENSYVDLHSSVKHAPQTIKPGV